jgi:23S rRNA (pseudouridine1915-N3)-methyltransferase
MKGWQEMGRDVSLVIGGADGLHPQLKTQAQWLVSLSKLTMPHGMVRVMLAEQLYRAHTVLSGHPYHRE